MLRYVHCRLRTLQRTAIELFLIDQTNYFLNFTKKEDRTKVLRTISKVKRGDSLFKVYGYNRKLSSVLKDSKLTEVGYLLIFIASGLLR